MSTARALGAVPTRRRSFLYGSVLLLGGVLYGFSFTYWRPLLRGDGFPVLIHVHAALWFGWFVLLAVQAFLVSRIKLAGHRRLGFATVAYTSVLVGVSLLLAVRTIARDANLVSSGVDAVPTIIPSSQILMFLVFFSWAIVKRGQPETHKRLLILAALVGSTPAIARISIGLLGAPNVPLIFAASNLLLIGVVLADWRLAGRLHRTYAVGGLAIIVVRTVRVPLAMSPAWAWVLERLSAAPVQ